MSKENKERLIIMLITMGLSLGGIWFILKTLPPEPPIVTAECPMLHTIVEPKYVSIEGWKCQGTTDREYDSDLLQPSGLWVNKVFSCWKLETPIEQYCAENPTHCSDRKS